MKAETPIKINRKEKERRTRRIKEKEKVINPMIKPKGKEKDRVWKTEKERRHTKENSTRVLGKTQAGKRPTSLADIATGVID